MRAAKNYQTRGRKHNASDTRIGDLLFTARQRLMWEAMAVQKFRQGDARAHRRKADEAIKALRALGYTGEI